MDQWHTRRLLTKRMLSPGPVNPRICREGPKLWLEHREEDDEKIRRRCHRSRPEQPSPNRARQLGMQSGERVRGRFQERRQGPRDVSFKQVLPSAAAGGKSRRVSLMTAIVYESFFMFSIVGTPVPIRVSTSWRTFSSTSGCWERT